MHVPPPHRQSPPLECAVVVVVVHVCPVAHVDRCGASESAQLGVLYSSIHITHRGTSTSTFPISLHFVVVRVRGCYDVVVVESTLFLARTNDETFLLLLGRCTISLSLSLSLSLFLYS